MRQVGSGWALLAPLLVLAACGRVAGPPGAAAPAPASHSGSRAHHPLSSTVTHPARPFPRVSTLRMVSPDVGWAVAGGARGGVLLRTTDGGHTWRDVTPAGFGAVAGGAATAAFLNAQDAWAVAGGSRGFTVFRTTDAGTSWQRTALPAAPALGFSLSFADAEHGWLLVDKGAGMFHEAVDLYGTVDGGAHWSVVSRTRANGGTPGALPLEGEKGGITFASPTVGWVPILDPAGASLYRTADAGRTWRPQRLPVPAGARGAPGGGTGVERVMLLTFPFTTTGEVAVQVIQPPKHPGDPGRFLWTIDRTRDGGRTWATAPALPVRGVFAWLGARHGWALAGPKLEVTVDGGKTWRDVPADTSLSGMRQLDFVSPRFGWAVGDSPPGSTRWALLRTTDGGRVWNRLHPALIDP